MDDMEGRKATTTDRSRAKNQNIYLKYLEI